MLDANVKARLKTYLERLMQPVEPVANIDGSEGPHDMMGLLCSMAGRSSTIVLTEQRDTIERTPSSLVRRAGTGVNAYFAAIPTDREFTPLVLALLQVGGYAPKFEADVVEQIRNIEGDFRFETYMSLVCQGCPGVIQALDAMSVIGPYTQHIAIDGALFQGEIEAHQIMAVPTVFLNSEMSDTGRMDVGEILVKIGTSAIIRDAEKLAAKEAFDVLTIGGGLTGATAAVYATHKGMHTDVVAKRFDGRVLDTLGIESFISVQETEGPKFAVALEQHVRQYDVDIMSTQRAIGLTPADEPGDFTEATLADDMVLKGRSAILSTGVRWHSINIPGEQKYKNRGVAHCPHCDGLLSKSKHMTIIGGSNSSTEVAIDLAGLVNHVTLLKFTGELKADVVLVRKLQGLSNATIVTNVQTTKITGDGQEVNGLRYKSHINGIEHTVALRDVFVQIGLVLNTEQLDGVFRYNRFDGVAVDARGQTSVEGILAVDDTTATSHKRTIVVTDDGAEATLSTFGHLIHIPLAEVV